MREIKLSLEELENDYWKPLTEYPTGLIKNVYILRKKQVDKLNANELRLLISQNVGLKYLIPIAIERLRKDPLVEAFYYPGDILLAVLNSSEEYWSKNPAQKEQVINLINSTDILSTDLIEEEIKSDFIRAINKLIAIA